MLVIAGVIAGATFVATIFAAEPAEVRVLSCTSDDAGFFTPATARMSVKNTSSSTKSFTISIEYRDSTGDRIDIDRTRVRDVRPGDTVKVEESTMLDSAPVGALSCTATLVD
ncbi:hypothetical protein KOI35_43930 [Actinoplanes bogorensis]|uniref:Uncharacterized protein n=1 Tax=Paractinoplanes bogorensis TaxID=1610840 RepID=A0ABS5Z6A7_9ACTN|nr:hypothetical protein [Actinoplanes bogorensis]MBU2670473.1 hypothetical protein [Actinoplanes bogorensis]